MKFLLHWLDGKKEQVEGNTIAEAFTHAGYGNGALKALDWFEPVYEPPTQEDKERIAKSIIFKIVETEKIQMGRLSDQTEKANIGA